MAVTIKDLARRLNVSTSVVSTVLNGKKYCGVSDELRKKVLAMAEELKCCPNANARALRCGRSDLIGVMMPVPVIRWYSQFVTYFQQKLQKKGKTALFFFWNASSSRAEQRAAYDRMIGYGVDGIILWDDFGFRDSPTPTVIYNEELQLDLDYDRVDVHWDEVIRQALEVASLRGGKIGMVCCEGDRKLKSIQENSQFALDMVIYCDGGEKNAGQKIWEKLNSQPNDVWTLFFANVENLLSFSLELFRHAPDKAKDYTFINFEGFSEELPDSLNVISCNSHWQELADALIDVLMEKCKNPELPPIRRDVYPQLVIKNTDGK